MLKPYTLTIGRTVSTVLLSDEDAATYGENAIPASEPAPTAPARPHPDPGPAEGKARYPQDKARRPSDK